MGAGELSRKPDERGGKGGWQYPCSLDATEARDRPPSACESLYSDATLPLSFATNLSFFFFFMTFSPFQHGTITFGQNKMQTQ